MFYPSGKAFDGNRVSLAEELLPSRDDVLYGINEMRIRSEKWILELDFDAENSDFPWAGKTARSVVMFLLRHMVYHIGELNALYYTSNNGNVKDLFVHALNQIRE